MYFFFSSFCPLFPWPKIIIYHTSLNPKVAIKNSVDVFYFATVMPIHIFFTEDGAMDKRVFLSTWKDIPSQNEVQFNIENINLNAGE